ERARAALREGPRRRAGALALAALFGFLWLSSAFNTDGTIELANPSVVDNIAFWSDEAFALLGGHAPLVDFHAQYGHLWAYVAAGGMAVGPLEDRYGPANLFSLFPIRYAGPYVLLWLVVRRVRRGTTGTPVALFALAGLVAINNLEFGLAA